MNSFSRDSGVANSGWWYTGFCGSETVQSSSKRSKLRDCSITPQDDVLNVEYTRSMPPQTGYPALQTAACPARHWGARTGFGGPDILGAQGPGQGERQSDNFI